MTQLLEEDDEFLTPLGQRNSCKKWYNKNRELVLE